VVSGDGPLLALARGGPGVLDGGLATELEARGHDLRDRLWAARLLIDAPEEIEAVHRSYLEAGAQVVVSASYQATIGGFLEQGLRPAQARAQILGAAAIARRAARDFPGALVAASVGPYGAALADGSEFRGDYGLSARELRDWHAERFALLARSGADLLACETIPSGPEAVALGDLLDEHDTTWAWFTFTCRDGARLRDGTPVEEAVDAVAGRAGTAGVGVNCSAPRFVEELTGRIFARVGGRLPVVVYPNSGETWEPATRGWSGDASIDAWIDAARRWRAAGATAIGGCCRTGPEHIRRLRALLQS